MTESPRALLPLENELALTTDLYQLTMMAAYHARGMLEEATFELWVRSLPAERGFLLTAGLEQALHYLCGLRFTGEQVRWLREHPTFAHVGDDFFDYLRSLRFSGHVDAMAEGTVAFAGEPILRVTAPLPEAQLAESYLLATINFQTLVASKAARVRLAAGERQVVDFGMRRAHGPHAGVLAARASWLAGFDGTSCVEAGWRLGIPIVGTMAHAYVMAFEREEDAFAHYRATFPESCVLLIDTYDTVEGCRKAAAFGSGVQGVRLDSGDLAELAVRCRRILDDAGMTDTRIFASSDLNEDRIAEIVAAGAPIDAFGVGTELVTSYDAPALGGIYKLVQHLQDGRRIYTCKLSEDKATYPGAKQVWRRTDAEGRMAGDVLELAGSPAPAAAAAPLLERVMEAGRTVAGTPGLDAGRERARAQLAALPRRFEKLHRFETYPVEVGPELEVLAERLRRDHGGGTGRGAADRGGTRGSARRD